MKMRATAMVAGLIGGTALLVGPVATPAGAATTVTSSGTTVSADVDGRSSVQFACVGGNVRINGLQPTPAVACTAVTSIGVTGDSAAQFVYADALDDGRFPNLNRVSILTGGGDDFVWGSTIAESIWTATGNDQVSLPAHGADDILVLVGTDPSDFLTYQGSPGNDDVEVTSKSASETTIVNGTWTADATTRFLHVNGNAGHDSIDASAVESSIFAFSADGGTGNDVVEGGPSNGYLQGGSGTNTLIGGPNGDNLLSSSTSDTIRGGGGADTIVDTGDGRVGGRTIDAPGASPDGWVVDLPGDTFIRSRPGSGATTEVTTALSRRGQQVLPGGINSVSYRIHGTGQPVDRVLAELRPLSQTAQGLGGPGHAQTVVDVVVPTGNWTVTSGRVEFTGGYEDIFVGANATLNVRRPYTDPEERFAHRILRDVEMRIPSSGERATYAGLLEAGTLTRTQIVLERTSTDVYRGLDVDRTFVDVLRRSTDSAGRAYWIGRLRDGMLLRKLRANLYGSPEYFTGRGRGEVASYVAAAYQDILGRQAGSTEVDYWAGVIESGTPRGTVAERFLNTPEARAVLIEDLFLRWVGRYPTAGEVATWSPQVAATSTDGELALIRFLAGSAEYFNRADG